MYWLRLIYSRLYGLLRKDRIEREMEEEMRFHLRMRTSENIEREMSPDEAEREARRRFGNVGRIKDLSRDIKGGGFMESLWQDLRYGVRMLTKSPWQTGFAIAALAIGIGANTGVFSVVNALLLRSLPFREPDRLALLHEFIPPHDTAKQFHEWSQQSAYLADAAVFEEIDANLGGTRIAIRVHVAQTSWNFFSMLGTQPVLGRGFVPGDDVDGTGWGLPGRNAVVVISYGLWQQVFGADPRALGATIRLDGHPLTVIGVAPPGFDFPRRAVIWKPAAFSPGNNGWVTVARLKPGVP